jgi:bifunctional non-homologous end joining protein LigD
MVETSRKTIARIGKRHHAFVAGWSRRNAKSLNLLLGVRSGRRRKLTYVGEVKVQPRALFINLLERRLRRSEIEASPFQDEVPADDDSVSHWVAPELVAEIDFEGWTKAGGVRRPKLYTIEEHGLLSRPRWIMVPKR